MESGDRPGIRTEVQVMFFDTDCAAVVHNIAYLRFIETNRTLLAERLGLRLRQMTEEKKYPVVVRTEIDYRRAAGLGDELAIEGWLDRIERVRFWCAFRITRPADDALIAECRQTLAIVEMPSAKLLGFPTNGTNTGFLTPARDLALDPNFKRTFRSRIKIMIKSRSSWPNE